MTLSAETINVIEVRKAKNGFVVSAWMRDPHSFRDDASGRVRGFATYVVQSHDPEEVGKAVAQALAEYAITSDVAIPPARELP